MTISFYMDVHFPSPITNSLRIRGVDVLTAQENGASELADQDLLNRASKLGRILVTQDTDLLAEATSRHRTGGSFIGVIFAPQIGTTIRQCVEDLELIAKAGKPSEWINRVEYLPLK
jgi:predicted nuclease of predicted toxin-antitoxin system